MRGGERTNERREQILEAAYHTLVQVGFEKITTRRIAQEAGVNIATLHYHFGTKEALLSEVVRYTVQRVESRLRAAMQAAPTPAEGLAMAFRTVWEIAQERPGILRYDLVLRALRDEAARSEAKSIYATYRRLVEDIAERHLAEGGTLPSGVTPATLAHYLVSVVDGILLQHLVTGDAKAARNSLEIVRRHALSLLGRGDGNGGSGI